MNREQIEQLLLELPAENVPTLAQLVRTWTRTNTNGRAFIEELIEFQYDGLDPKTGLYYTRMHISDSVKNFMDILHGGALATFIDTSMGAAVYHELKGEKAVTVNLNLQFLSPGIEGELVGETKINKKGRSLLFAECNVYDVKKKHLTTASSTFFRT